MPISNGLIDLRSDTVTEPSDEMRVDQVDRQVWVVRVDARDGFTGFSAR